MFTRAREELDDLVVVPVCIVGRFAGCCLLRCSVSNFPQDPSFTWLVDVIKFCATDEVLVCGRLGGANLLVNVYSSFWVFFGKNSGVVGRAASAPAPSWAEPPSLVRVLETVV